MESELFRLFLELHKDLPRQAPGSRESTLRALSVLGLGREALVLADMGCGPGAHTLDLLESLTCQAVAFDLLAEFLAELRQRAEQAGCADRVLPLLADMARPPLAPGSCDCIWSEGAVYNMGFDQGLATWAPLLRDDGFLALSELCWLVPQPPRQAQGFWAEEYPAMRGVEANLRALEQAGFASLDWFVLPDDDWWRDYYSPLEERLQPFVERHGNSDAAREVAAMERRELDIRRRHGQSFGYVFFLARRQG